MKEYILCAAILRKIPRDCNPYYNNDITKIEIGYRHHDIIQRFPGELDIHSQGFYTSKGRFVSRTEAMKIALEANQVSESIAISGRTYDGEIVYNSLFSEDLY